MHTILHRMTVAHGLRRTIKVLGYESAKVIFRRGLHVGYMWPICSPCSPKREGPLTGGPLIRVVERRRRALRI